MCFQMIQLDFVWKRIFSMLILFLYIFLLMLKVCSIRQIKILNSIMIIDLVANRIKDYLNRNKIPIIIKEKILDDDADSMSTTYLVY